MKRLWFLLCCMAATVCVTAQNVGTCSDDDFRYLMDNLVTKGNHFYELSDRRGIMQMLDSINSCIQQRSQHGNLSVMDSLEYRADWYKLSGSYHYENSYYDSTSHVKAHECYQEALKIYKQAFSSDMDLQKVPMIHRELALLCYKEKNYPEAYRYMKLAYDAFEQAVPRQDIDEDDADYLMIQTQLAMCLARMGNTKEALVLMERLQNRYKDNEEQYAEALRKKAKILMLQEEEGGTGNRSVALDCYKQFFASKKQDALAHFMGMNSAQREQYWMRVRPFVVDCYRLEDADAGFLYDVTLFAKGLLLQLDSAGGMRQPIHATWQMVQEKLQPDACAIEFVQYEKYGQQQMGALVLKKTGEPVFVKMASPDSVWKYKIGDDTVEERLSGTGRSSFKAINRVYNDSLGFWKKIWNNELLSAIASVKKVYFAPDGYAHRIAIEYMFPKAYPPKRLLRLSSTRRLLEPVVSLTAQSALVIGDVRYDDKTPQKAGDNDALAYKTMSGIAFPEISDSRKELDSILFVRHHPSDVLLAAEGATEDELRAQCGKYSIVHLSTHGKLLAKDIPYGTDLKTCLTDESLSENIVALAGVNVALRDEHFNPDQTHDGLLSAKEMASLDMSNTQLVVLACCETGLGQITADGVYGIQRGLKNAGAGMIIMSLWEATSDTTTRFMIAFHQKLKEGMAVGEAFWQTRDAMWQSSDESEQEPCYWNVFILIDALE